MSRRTGSRPSAGFCTTRVSGTRTAPGITGPPFGPVHRHTVRWAHRISRAGLLDLVSSRSYIATMPAGQRALVLAEVGHLADTHPALAGREEFLLPYVTECFRTALC
jgi:hypothetical protein